MSKATAASTFIAYIDELTAMANLCESLSQLRTATKSVLNWTSEDKSSLDIVKGFIGNRADMNRMYQALYMNACAGFEQYIRDSIVDTGNAISALKLSGTVARQKDLSSLLDFAVVSSGHALATLQEPIGHLSFDYPNIARQALTCFGNSEAVEIPSLALTIKLGNLNAERIEGGFSKFGFKIKWNEFAVDAAIVAELEGTGARAREKELKDYFDGMLSQRNRLAHSQGSSADVGKTELRKQLKILKAFANKLSTSLNDYVASI